MWPLFYELNIGESFSLPTSEGTASVCLLEVRHFWGPEFWVQGNLRHRALKRAEVDVDISGERVSLVLCAFQMPVVVKGLRISVEITQEWARQCEHAAIQGVNRLVRFAALDAAKPWGPGDLVFPIKQFLWRSSTYNNTWGSLVPYNKLYYHRGEDFGTVADRLEAVSVMNGTVVQTPLPNGDGGSNWLQIQSESGISCTYGNMDIDTINPAMTLGAPVKAGQVIGKPGCARYGERVNKFDPHLHISLRRSEDLINPYPYIVQAYFNTFPDEALPVAGGNYYIKKGEEVNLRGDMSIARPGNSILEYVWHLHDGSVARSPNVTIRYPRPGLYSEEFWVCTNSGGVYRDFAQVRVYDPDHGSNIAHGWAFYYPVRDIKPGMPVLFCNRIQNSSEPVKIDYGDGTPREVLEWDTWHTYSRPGSYVAILKGRGPLGDPITLKLSVKVSKTGA